MQLLEDAVNHRDFSACRKYANLAYRLGSGVNVEPPVNPKSLFRKVNTQLILPWQEKRARLKQLASMHTLDDLVKNPEPLNSLGSDAGSIRNGLIHGLTNHNDLGLLRSYFSAYAIASGNELLATVSDDDMISISLGLLECEVERWQELKGDPVGMKQYLNSNMFRAFSIGIWLEREKRDIQFSLHPSGKYAVSLKPVLVPRTGFKSASAQKLKIKRIDGCWVWSMPLQPFNYFWADCAKQKPLVAVLISPNDEHLPLRLIELKVDSLPSQSRDLVDSSGWLDGISSPPEGFHLSRYNMCYLPKEGNNAFKMLPIHCYKNSNDEWLSKKPIGSELIPTTHPYGIKEGDFVKINHDYDASCGGVFLVSKLIMRAGIPQAVLVKMRVSIHEKLLPVTKIVPSFMLEKIKGNRSEDNG